MASVVKLHDLNSGRFASSLSAGFSARISVYLLRGNVTLPSRLLPIGCADLRELGTFRDGLGDVRRSLRLVAGWVCAGIELAPDVRKQELVVSGALGAINTASRYWHKLRVTLVERRILECEDDVVSIQNCRLRTGNRTRVGLLPPL